jgi:transglutaminase-like putative cysteine protease
MIVEQLRQLPGADKLWQRLEAIPPQKTEESMLLRILVQALVIVGIIATDVAAETQMSIWAIPLSITGAYWSWYRRKYRNITAKFLIALGMLFVLFLFFGELFPNRNDTRVVLAQLLVQLQVLHSFDIPRRKDLGYSTVIGLILLGVAGTISQTLSFAPWLLLFLAIALPVLVLDYRSRLGLENLDPLFFKRQYTQKRHNFLTYSPLSPQRLTIFFLAVLILGLGLFAIMPRFPGYQLQNFPVSLPSELDFDENQSFNENNTGISNPGYVSEGKEGTGLEGTGTSPTEGAGDLDPTFYYGFNSKMNQNLRGRMERKLVMRIRSQAPGFWKVLSFDHYTGQGWEISRDEDLITISRPSWTYRFNLSMPRPLIPTKRVIQSYTAVTSLPNIIPALSIPEVIYFPTREIGIDPEGSLRSPLGLLEGLTYTVISEVPYRDRTLLGQADQNHPKAITNYYLQLPPDIKAKVKPKTEEILAKSPKPLTNPYEKALFLTQYLKQNYQILPELPFFSDEDDVADVFLFRYSGGYPDHFSTTLTVMLRSIGIPSRLTVGFGAGQFNPFTGYYLVHNTDAYALTEVYFPKYGWFAFDPIPGHEIIPPSFEESQTFSVLRQFWQWIAGWLPSPITAFFSNLTNYIITWLGKSLSWLFSLFAQGFLGLITGSIIIIGFSFLLWLGWSQILTLNFRRKLNKLPQMERIYQEMLKTLQEKGNPKQPAQTPLEYVKSITANYPPVTAEIIEEITQAYVRWRYENQEQNLDYFQRQLRILTGNLNRHYLPKKRKLFQR